MATIKTVKMTGPIKNLIKVNESDVEAYKAKGYKLFVESVREDTILDNGEGQEKAIDDMKIDELKEFAERNKIDISEVTLKADIIETIRVALEQQNEDGSGEDGGETEEQEQ